MTLNLSPGDQASWSGSQHRANDALLVAGVSSVTLRVDENGNYVFTASYADSSSESGALAGLRSHIREVFGGAYDVHPIEGHENRRSKEGEAAEKRFNEGDAAVKRYNGITEEKGAQRVTPPLGALNFYQLNTLAEGLWNDMLLPAVYLEDKFMAGHLHNPDSTSALRSIGDVIDVLTIPADASAPKGQFAVLYHFVAITANSSLQRLKSSLESVRRHLLDETMSALHRQSRLVQLNFGAQDREGAPELAVGATESQLRGYVALVAAKLPLISSVYAIMRLVREHLRWVVTGPEDGGLSAAERKSLKKELWRLDGQLDHWNTLLGDLEKNVKSLETCIEHAWMERVLYEQQQTRSEQEAMAEVERSRQGQPGVERLGRPSYNFVMVILTAIAVLVTLANTDIQRLVLRDTSIEQKVVLLWPVWALVFGAFGVLPAVRRVRRAYKEMHGRLNSYPYEFAFRLDEPVNPGKLCTSLANVQRRRVTADRLRGLTMTNRGFGRIERVSVDTTIVKTHCAATFRARLLRYARFEIINEIFVHRVSNNTQHVLVQCRVFGESPRPLTAAQVIALVTAVLHDVGEQILQDGKRHLTSVLDESLHCNPIARANGTEREAEASPGKPAPARELVTPGQRSSS